MPIVAKYPLNGNANALVGTNGTANNMTWGDGVMNGAGIGNGANGFIQVPSNLGINGGNVTIFLFIKRSSTAVGCPIYMHNSATSTGFYIYLEDTIVQFGRTKSNVGNQGYNHSITLATNVWYNLALTYDTTTQLVKGYINGQFVGQSSASGNGSGNSTNLLNLFAYNNGSNNILFFSGSIDEPQIYNHTLSDAEIKNLYSYYKGYYGL